MTQTQLQINGVENATTQTGKTYSKIHTNMGTLSCWNNNVAQALMQKTGQMVNVEVKQNGNFSSIVGLAGTAIPQQAQQFGQKPFSIGNVSAPKQKSSFELSYAKDIFCVLAAGYENEDAVKKDEMLRYYAELSVDLILKMRKALEQTDGIEEEKVV